MASIHDKTDIKSFGRGIDKKQHEIIRTLLLILGHFSNTFNQELQQT